MQIKEFLNAVCEKIKYTPIRNEISEEIENHIEELKKNYIEEENIAESEAEEKAISQMGNPEEIGIKLNKIHKPKLDWKLMLVLLVLLSFGLLISIIRANNYIFNENYTNATNKYIGYLLLGTILSIGIYFFDYRKLKKYSNIIYLIATLVIVYPMFFGIKMYGREYIRIASITVAPVILAMPLYIISFVGFIENINKNNNILIESLKIRLNINKDILKIIILSIISLILIGQIPSLTSSLILGITYLIIGTVKLSKLKENRKKYINILWLVPVTLALSILLIYSNNFRMERLISSFNPQSDPNGSGWLGMQQKIILNSANLYGEAANTSDSLNLFDEGTNFAFISILAHYGWIIAIGMVIAVLLLCITLIINAIKIKDMYGKLLVIGISCVFILQSIFNILMNFNIGIKADFNIPFVSYGGVSLVINMISFALILSIYRRKDILICEKVA